VLRLLLSIDLGLAIACSSPTSCERRQSD